MSNRKTALRLVRADISTFPADQTKKPLVRFTAAATRNESGVDYFWQRYGANALPAINLSGCGLVVIDLDRGHADGVDGVAEFDKLLDLYGELPVCPAVRTPRGGVHLYFRQPEGREPLGNSAGRIAPGIDVRGHHGFTVAPGAVLASGEFYETVDGTPDLCEAFASGEILVIPNWLVDLAERPVVQESSPRGPSPCGVIPSGRLRSFALAVLEGEAAELASAPVGKRNDSLNKAAFVIASKGGAHGAVSETEAWAALWAACVVNGYVNSTATGDGPKAFEVSFYSGWGGGLAKPSAGPRERNTAIDPAFTAGLKPRAA